MSILKTTDKEIINNKFTNKRTIYYITIMNHVRKITTESKIKTKKKYIRPVRLIKIK